ncbi:cytochrome c3 family protein [Solitalea lacus]
MSGSWTCHYKLLLRFRTCENCHDAHLSRFSRLLRQNDCWLCGQVW